MFWNLSGLVWSRDILRHSEVNPREREKKTGTMSGSIVGRFSRCVCDRIRSFRPLSSDPIGFRRYSAGPKDDDEEVTEEELKRRIQRFYDGDGEALPSIFEAILKRKLAGKNDEGLIDQLPIGGRPDLTDSSGESE